MLVTCLSWLVMVFIFFSLGLLSVQIIKFLFKYRIENLYTFIIMGIVCTTVYAETFSLFYKIRKLSFVLLFTVCSIILLIYKKYTKNRVYRCIKNINKYRLKYFCVFIISISIIIFVSYISSRTPGGYDTENYHIPTIRWLEEYGIAKGLGNLHTRFAYNSSFLCLQAIFSFPWVCKISLHSLNGFLLMFFAIYCVTTFKFIKYQKLYLSDILRILFLFIMFRYDEICNISSPNTDFMPMCITAYIFIEWCNLTEFKVRNYLPYCLLAILGLFCASVKLSAGILLIFGIKPFIDILRDRKLSYIVYILLISSVVIVPFLARNVIISGYLLYPNTFIDLFNVDWKMPHSVVISDSISIKTFARTWGSGYSYQDISRSFFDWFFIWISKSQEYFDIFGILDIILSLVVFIGVLITILKKKGVFYSYMLPISAAAGFIFLLFSAPSVRFGRWWFFVLPITLVYFCIINVFYKSTKNKSYKINSIKLMPISFLIAIFMSSYCMAINIHYDGGVAGFKSMYVFPKDYSRNGNKGDFCVINGYRFYYYSPKNKDNRLNGYDGFPGSECLATLQKIEMRGDSLADGFRVKGKFKNILYDFQGNILNNEQIKKMKIKQ